MQIFDDFFYSQGYFFVLTGIFFATSCLIPKFVNKNYGANIVLVEKKQIYY